jgi:hypothetical protein
MMYSINENTYEIKMIEKVKKFDEKIWYKTISKNEYYMCMYDD